MGWVDGEAVKEFTASTIKIKSRIRKYFGKKVSGSILETAARISLKSGCIE